MSSSVSQGLPTWIASGVLKRGGTISTQSKPAPTAHFAACTCSFIVSSISFSVIAFAFSLGTRPRGVNRFVALQFVALALRGCFPPSWTETANLPVCLLYQREAMSGNLGRTYMPELASDESTFCVHCVGDELPRFNMFLGIYPGNIQEISCLFQNCQ
jgi:hypothetical protein